MKIINTNYKIIEPLCDPILVCADMIKGPQQYKYAIFNRNLDFIKNIDKNILKITDDIKNISNEDYLDKIIEEKKYNLLMHGTIYLFESFNKNNNALLKYKNSPCSHLKIIGNKKYKTHDSIDGYYVTTNLREIIENNWINDLEYICEPTKYHDKCVTVSFECEENFINYFNFFPFLLYNYSRIINDEELTIINPNVDKFKEGYYGYQEDCSYPYDITNETYFYNNKPILNEKDVENATFIKDDNVAFIDALTALECCIYKILKSNPDTNDILSILPLGIKMNLVVTGFVSDWYKFFNVVNKKENIKKDIKNCLLLLENDIKNKNI